LSALVIAHPHDGLPACRERLAERGYGVAGFKTALDLGAFVRCQARWPADGFALRPRTAQPGLGAFDQQVAFELGDRVDDAHRQLARWRGEIDAAQRQAMDADAHPIKIGDGAGNVHRVATEAVELGDDEHVAVFEPVEQPGKALALLGRDRPGDGFGDHPPRLCHEAGGLDLE